MPPLTAILCNGAQLPTQDGSNFHDVISLDYRHDTTPTHALRLSLPDFVRNVLYLPERVLDLLEIASYVFSADRLVSRGRKDLLEYHSWGRDLDFYIRVRDSDFWNSEEVKGILARLLRFLTGDKSYKFNFQSGHQTPPTGLFDKEGFSISTGQPASVVLFSGGVDSFTGAVDRILNTEEIVYLISHRTQPRIIRTQDALYGALDREYNQRVRHYKFKCTLKYHKASEESQRSRSFLYCSIAFALATALGISELYVYENGVTSINLPKRQDLISGRASRTTHPKTIKAIEDLFSLISESEFRIKNPYVWMTKTDVMKNLKSFGVSQLLSSTVSCGRGRLNFSPGTHCGWCSQCIDRRLAAYAAQMEDKDDRTGIYNIDLCTPVNDRSARGAFREFLHQAQRYATSSMEDFYTEYLSELTELIECYRDLAEEEVIEKLYDLHSRHGQQVGQAIQAIRRIDHPFEPTSPGSFVELIVRKSYLHSNKNSAELVAKLIAVKPGKEDAKKYEGTMLEILTALFNPYLTDAHPQVRSVDGLEIMDITYRNRANSGFWHDIKTKHGNNVVVFELKNRNKLSNEDFNQISERLDRRIGLLGVLVARSKTERDFARAYRRYNKHDHVIIVLDDSDICKMLDKMEVGDDPTFHIDSVYREFIEKA